MNDYYDNGKYYKADDKPISILSKEDERIHYENTKKAQNTMKDFIKRNNVPLNIKYKYN